MLHLLYILAFTFLAFVAVGNLVRNLLAFSAESQRKPVTTPDIVRRPQPVPHPELLDEQGRMLEEPLLVMRSIGIEDAREQLDALYKSSPGSNNNTSQDDDDTPPPALL